MKGGQVFGDKASGYYPDLQNLTAIDTGQGRLIPGVAVDEYARDMLTWFGISASNLDYVLPSFSTRFAGRNALGIFGDTAVTPPPPPPPPAPPSQPWEWVTSSFCYLFELELPP